MKETVTGRPPGSCCLLIMLQRWMVAAAVAQLRIHSETMQRPIWLVTMQKKASTSSNTET